MYLKAAAWGFDQMIKCHLSGYAFRFHLIGILASLRAVQHALDAHDRNLSDDHKVVVREWWDAHKELRAFPALEFIKQSRDLILKRGKFQAFATLSESGTVQVDASRYYDLAYYDDGGERRDLAGSIIDAIEWCDAELFKMECRLPEVVAQ
jgi:hypothetical protein